MVILAIALMLAMVLLAAVAMLRKRTAPLKEPPLHLSTLIATMAMQPRFYSATSAVARSSDRA